MEPPRGFTESMIRLWEEFCRMPGIGRRSAERLVYHVLNGSPEDAQRLARAAADVKTKVGLCRVCYNIAETDLCRICRDETRDRGVLCIVEEPRDLLALESTGGYRGLYHVLHGRLSPLDGVEPDNLTIGPLEERVRSAEDPEVREVILATNPNVEGDATSLYIAERLGQLGVRVTRLARGLPAGGTIEHATAGILNDAIEGRQDLPKG